MQHLFGELILLMSVYASSGFILSLIFKRNDIADIAWGGGFILVCIYLILHAETSSIVWVMYTCVIAWGIRLAIHIFMKNRKKAEDFRYAQRRKDRGSWFYLRSFLQIYVLQGFLVLIVMLPIILASIAPSHSWGVLETLGLFLWVLGFFFESVGDYQLLQFKKQHHTPGSILQTGLWKYSRHPNYFGEISMRRGIGLLGLSGIYGIYGLIGPAVITYLIIFVSGVAPLENKYKSNEAYQLYKKQTPMLIPGRTTTEQR